MRSVIDEFIGPLLRVSSPEQIRWPEVGRALSALTLSDLGPFSLKRSGTGGSSSGNTSPSRMLAGMGRHHGSNTNNVYSDLASLAMHEYKPLPPNLSALSAAFTSPAPMSLFDVEASFEHSTFNKRAWSSSVFGSGKSAYDGAPPVVAHAATMTLLSTPVAEVSLFVLPPGRRMQMHDHPGQHVMCRVLHGRLQDLSIDWTYRDPNPNVSANVDAARAELNNELVNLHASYLSTSAGREAASRGMLGPRLRELVRCFQQRQQQEYQRQMYQQYHQQQQQQVPLPSFETQYDGVVVRTATHLGDSEKHHQHQHHHPTSSSPSLVEFSAATGGGVLHEFSAPPDAPAIFVDVIAPPYFAAPWCIDCGYYKWRSATGGPSASVKVGDKVVLGFDETSNMVFDDLVAA